MEKMTYTAPEIEVVTLEETDIVLISINDSGETGNTPIIPW